MGNHRADLSDGDEVVSSSGDPRAEPAVDASAEVAGEPSARRRRPRGRRRTRRILSIGMLVVGALVVLGALWTGWRTYQAYSHLADARATVADIDATIQADGLDGLDAVTDLADTLARQTAAAHAAVNDPVFRLAAHTPWIGDNLGAVRGVAASMDVIAQTATQAIPELAPLADHASWASGGRFDLAVLRPAAGAIDRLNDAVQGAVATVTGFDRGSLVAPVNTALNQYGAQLAKLSEMTTVGADAANIVMPMLGADGPRTYLVVFQNLAEARPTGGIFGFYATLHVQDGTLTLGAAGSSDRDLGPFDEPVVDLPAGYDDLYWRGMAQWPQNVNLTPDFPTAAKTFATMYQRHTGTSVDGVIAIDPVVVSVLMRGVAPIDIGEGLTLSSDTAVHTLLAGIYDAFPGGARLSGRDALMTKAVGTAFGAVLGNVGQLEPKVLIDDLTALTGERRLLIWSADAAEQGRILGTALAGRQEPDTADKPTVGVFLVDSNGGKMSYYLRAKADLGTAACSPGGRATAPLTITIEDTAPPSGLPPYVTAGAGGSSDYVIHTSVILTGPSGSDVADVGDILVDGVRVPKRIGMDRGRPTAVFSIATTSRQTARISTTISFSAAVQSDDGGAVTPSLVTSPMAFPFPTTAKSFTECE